VGDGYDVAAPDLGIYGDGGPAVSVYEQLKDDLGYLQLGRAAETFATLAETAKRRTGPTCSSSPSSSATKSPPPRIGAWPHAAALRPLPVPRTLEEFDFDFQPSVDRKLVDDLASLRFVGEGRPVLFLGQPGCGKTHLAVALAIKVVEAGWRGYFTMGRTTLVGALLRHYSG
jgi:hypothetical protein